MRQRIPKEDVLVSKNEKGFIVRQACCCHRIVPQPIKDRMKARPQECRIGSHVALLIAVITLSMPHSVFALFHSCGHCTPSKVIPTLRFFVGLVLLFVPLVLYLSFSLSLTHFFFLFFVFFCSPK